MLKLYYVIETVKRHVGRYILTKLGTSIARFNFQEHSTLFDFVF